MRNVPCVAHQLISSPEIRPPGTFLDRSHAIFPIVAIRETASGPADNRRLDFLQSIHKRLADSADIRHLRSLTHPNAVVNNSAEMLRKMAIDVGRNRTERLIQQNINARIRCGRGRKHRMSSQDRRSRSNRRVAHESPSPNRHRYPLNYFAVVLMILRSPWAQASMKVAFLDLTRSPKSRCNLAKSNPRWLCATLIRPS